MWGDLLILMIYHCSGRFSNRNQSEPVSSDWKLIGNWSDSVLSGPIRNWLDKLDKFPTIWMGLCSRISDQIPSGSDWFRLENVGHRQDLWKQDGEGKVICWKARYIVKGFQQKFGMDFTETFTPTIRPATLQILLSIVAQKNATTIQADAKNAYLQMRYSIWRYQKNTYSFTNCPGIYRIYR